MSDAKIVEFKKYGIGHRIPHIATIAATSDADFVYSVLCKAEAEMNERGKIFGTLQCSNLKNFRKKYGLAYPRVVIVMDEVESTFKMAGKLAGKIADKIDAFARLGRAAGYHIFMATQNMSSEIPKSAVGQIRIRLCLGANQSTSESVLGNDGATNNFGRIGRLIANTEVMNGGNTRPFNVEFQTPFLTDENFSTEMEELERLGQQVKFQSHMAFYDEEDIKTIETFDPVIDKALARMSKEGETGGSKSSIVLGYPAFVSTDPDELLKIHLNQKDVENIIICSSQTEHSGVLIHLIAKSLGAGWNQLHYSSDSDMFQYTPKAIDMQEARDATQRPLDGLDALIRKRLFLAYADNIIKNEGSISYKQETAEKIFSDCKIPKEVWGNSLMCRRAIFFQIVQKDATHKTMWTPVAPLFPDFSVYYNECVKYNAIVEPITVDKFSKVVYFIGDLSKIVGYGRDNNSRAVAALKKAMQDSNRAGVLFVLYSRSMEGLNDLTSGMRYCIFDAPDSKDWGRMRTEAPVALSERLAVLYDTLNTQTPQSKFKRTLLRDEF